MESQSVVNEGVGVAISWDKKLNWLHQGIEQTPTWKCHAGILMLTASIVWADVATPPYVFMTGFYLLPIFLANWYAERRVSGSVVAISIAASIHTISLVTPPEAPFWQAATAYASQSTIFITFSALIQYLRSVLTKLKAESRTDSLTGVYSRHHFLDQGQAELYRRARAPQPLTLAIIDLDNFKNVNDAHGHARGDALLAAVGACLQNTVRHGDVVGRLGGDEFAIALVGADDIAAREVLERIQHALSAVLQSFSRTTSASIGAVMLLPEFALSIEQLCDEADKVMYMVKQSTKNGLLIQIYRSPSP